MTCFDNIQLGMIGGYARDVLTSAFTPQSLERKRVLRGKNKQKELNFAHSRRARFVFSPQSDILQSQWILDENIITRMHDCVAFQAALFSLKYGNFSFF